MLLGTTQWVVVYRGTNGKKMKQANLNSFSMPLIILVKGLQSGCKVNCGIQEVGYYGYNGLGSLDRDVWWPNRYFASKLV